MKYTFHVEVSAPLFSFVEQVLTRLRYLYPSSEFSFADGMITAATDGDVDLLKRDISYQIYREKIYQEALPMRELMYRTLLA